MGYEFQHIQTEVQDINPLYGRDQYAGQFTRPTGATANNLYNLADFMFGLRSTFAVSNLLVANLRQNMHFAYLQDDIRVNDRLTVNAGLRYGTRPRTGNATTCCRTSIPRPSPWWWRRMDRSKIAPP